MNFISSSSKPIVSIICICYNHELYVQSSLDSVLAQTYENVEIIIIDDCSTDNSVDAIKKWIKFNKKGIFIENTSNLGNVRSFNKGFEMSTGEYIVDFATDDILLPNFVLHHILNFERSEYADAGVSYSNVQTVDENLRHKKYSFNTENENPPEGFIYNEVLRKYFINPVGYMMRRSTIERMGGYDETLAFEDLNYIILTSRFYPVIYLNEVLAQKRDLSSSMTRFFFKRFSKRGMVLRQSTYRICKKAFFLNESRAEDIALMHRIFLEFRLNIENFQFGLAIQYVFLSSRILIISLFRSD